jgi:histone H3/H4
MQINEKRPPRDEKRQQLRRELFERIVRNEARRRTEQNDLKEVQKA